ncbi:hypothetical protein CKJ69_17825 [Mycobacterium avium]|nr:hypothetical protein N602_27460 [Mycobacterium avium subsp. hominissuis 10-5606]PBA13482.1 hypothetical protein CKJ69_17825 [Mycobacterium avium]PBA89524.1 hypothetical protein CKJ60_17825 [Mycobacterium avium]
MLNGCRSHGQTRSQIDLWLYSHAHRLALSLFGAFGDAMPGAVIVEAGSRFEQDFCVRLLEIPHTSSTVARTQVERQSQ